MVQRKDLEDRLVKTASQYYQRTLRLKLSANQLPANGLLRDDSREYAGKSPKSVLLRRSSFRRVLIKSSDKEFDQKVSTENFLAKSWLGK